jgi:hypothetical protein
MENKDVKVGMKVVPHSKSIFKSLSDSMWNPESQSYLYVTGKDKNGWTLNIYDDEDNNGDYFLAEDFEPYEEQKEEEKVYTKEDLKNLIGLIKELNIKVLCELTYDEIIERFEQEKREVELYSDFI